MSVKYSLRYKASWARVNNMNKVIQNTKIINTRFKFIDYCIFEYRSVQLDHDTIIWSILNSHNSSTLVTE